MASSSQDPTAIHARARKLVATLEFQLQQLEDGAPGASDAESPSALTENLNRLFQDAALLERVVEETTVDQRRDLWRKRASQLSAEAGTQRRAVERFLKTTYAARMEQRERSLLLGGSGVSCCATLPAAAPAAAAAVLQWLGLLPALLPVLLSPVLSLPLMLQLLLPPLTCPCRGATVWQWMPFSQSAPLWPAVMP
jgi:hypothetical protein